MTEKVEIFQFETERDPSILLKSLSTNNTILIVLLIIFVIFLILTIWFVYYTVYKIQQNITTINNESKEALTIITNGQTDVESTLTKINASAAETLATEEDIIGFIKSACTVPPYKFLPGCKIINGQ